MTCTREICDCCKRVSAAGFSVPDKVWKDVVPDEFINGVLCLSCFAMYGDEKLIAWCRVIEVYPISLRLHALFSRDVGDNQENLFEEHNNDRQENNSSIIQQASD